MDGWERGSIPVVGQVFEPLLDCREHAHFVIEPGQLFGSSPLQGIEISKQQSMDRGDDKGCALRSGFLTRC